MRKKTPDKLYYSITEVSELTSVKPHVLRYWETEFKALKPKKNRAGNRTYRSSDIKLVLLIRKLLYEDGFTIAGAKKKLLETKSAVDKMKVPAPKGKRARLIQGIKKDLLEMQKILDSVK
jgi:DNA-binding transcriptional MerR regulator